MCNSAESLEPLSTEEQAVLVAIDPVNERLYARTPSNASPARADTPIPDFNDNDDQPEDENEPDNNESGPNTMVYNIEIEICVDRILRIMVLLCHVHYAKP